MNETNMESVESGESTSLDGSETLENSEESTEIFDETLMLTEYDVLVHMDETLTHIDSVAQYSASLLIIFMLVLILNYIYKFFKMFF